MRFLQQVGVVAPCPGVKGTSREKTNENLRTCRLPCRFLAGPRSTKRPRVFASPLDKQEHKTLIGRHANAYLRKQVAKGRTRPPLKPGFRSGLSFRDERAPADTSSRILLLG